MEDAIALAWAFRDRDDVPERAHRLRGRAPAGRREHAARRAGEPRVVRGHRALRRPGARASSRSTCSRAAGASRTTTCALRDPGFVATRRRRLRRSARAPAAAGASRRCSCRSACAISSCPTASSSRRWTCTPRSTASSSDFHLVHLGARGRRRRRARDDGDDLRRRRRAGSRRAAAGCTATTTSPAGSGSSTSSTPHGDGAHRRADRPQRAQGLHEAHVGGDGPAARGAAAGRSWRRRRCPTSPTARCRAR